MSDQIQKSPDLAERGFSENIHQDIANNQYFSMILNNRECARFCCDLLEQFDILLNRFDCTSPQAFRGSEVDAFIALKSIEKLSQAASDNAEALNE